MIKKLLAISLFGLLLLSFGLLMGNLPTEKSNLFSGSGNCTLCHSGSEGVLINSAGRDVSPVYHWQSSMMGNSAKDPYWQAKVSSEVEENPHLKEIIEDKCATCHAPMGRTEAVYNGQTHYSFEEVKTDPLSQDGVSCTVCHQIDPDNLSTYESFSGNYSIKALNTIYGPYVNPFTISMVNNTGYTPVYGSHIESSALCATCHNLITPYVDQDGNVAGYFPEQMPFYEWLNSSYPGKEMSCQKCHMPRVAEDFTIASMPPNLQNKRNPVFEHHFVGGNITVNRMMKENYSALGIKSELANLDTTAGYAQRNLIENTVELSTEASYSDGLVSIKTKLKNKTGHKIPSGFPSRRMWIHFTASDNEGEIIFESGKYDENGIIAGKPDLEEHHDTITIQENVQVYEAVLGNTQNELTTVLLEASQYLKDNRIPPDGFISGQPFDSLIAITGNAALDINFNKNDEGVQGTGSDEVTYTFPYSDDVLNYTVEICYQSIKPGFAGHLSESSTDESIRFTQMFSDSNLPKVTVISQLEEQINLAGIQIIESPVLKIYPNPSSGIINMTGLEQAADIKIYSLRGQIIKSYNQVSSTINLSGIRPGIYLLKIYAGDRVLVKKIVKE